MRYPVLLESLLTPGLVVYMTQNNCGIVVKTDKLFTVGEYSGIWSSSDEKYMGDNWKEYVGDITLTLKGKPEPLTMIEWLRKHRTIFENRFCAQNEYDFGKDNKKFFEVWDFTSEIGGTYVLFCEEYEISNVTKEQVINFAKSFGLELPND